MLPFLNVNNLLWHNTISMLTLNSSALARSVSGNDIGQPVIIFERTLENSHVVPTL